MGREQPEKKPEKQNRFQGDQDGPDDLCRQRKLAASPQEGKSEEQGSENHRADDERCIFIPRNRDLRFAGLAISTCRAGIVIHGKHGAAVGTHALG